MRRHPADDSAFPFSPGGGRNCPLYGIVAAGTQNFDTRRSRDVDFFNPEREFDCKKIVPGVPFMPNLMTDLGLVKVKCYICKIIRKPEITS